MFQFKWSHSTIETHEQMQDMLNLFIEQAPDIKKGAFDTETTGLHIKKDKPFIFQWGFVNERLKLGYTFLVDLQRKPKFAKSCIETWHKYAAKLKIYVAHNTKFDLHMLENIGVPYTESNISDTMFYIRYAHDNLTVENGGPPLGLKEYTALYINRYAKAHENELNRERTSISKKYNEDLKQRLKVCGKPPKNFNAASYTSKVLSDLFKDNIFTINDLPENVKNIYIQWFSELPKPIQARMIVKLGLVQSEDIPYDMLTREKLYQYAHMDIVFTLETLCQLEPVIIARGQELGLKIENSIIYPLLDMENTGFNADVAYLEESRTKMQNYIKARRNDLNALLGQEVSVGQHELIKTLLNNNFNLNLTSTNNENFENILSDLIRSNNPQDVNTIKTIETIQELRTLEKWYSAYIIRFLTALKYSPGRLYTQIGQVGTVSGRVVSDFQQFPRDPIKDKDGNELFNPRKIVKVTPSWKGILYLDYSQIELRIQAMYTILCGTPDLNLCRAYMPYKCLRKTNSGKVFVFDYTNPAEIKNFQQYAWYKLEDSQLWTPTDVHAETTINATGLTPDHPDFKHARSDIGKRTNFAKNYGANLKRIMQMFPRKTYEECSKINDAYYKTFPGIKGYHEYCKNAAYSLSNVPNLFGIKYYGTNAHKLKNLLIQGSAAYLFKIKMRELWLFLKNNNMKSRFQMNIHDEISWEVHPDDDIYKFFEIKEIMQNWEDTLVPIVAEMAFTKSTWAEKKDVHSKEELQCLITS